MNVLRDVPAPAKLNLFLHVIGRRADGYHLLQTVFRFIDLADTLHFTRRDDGQVRRTTPLPGVPSEQCLTVRAALALQRASGSRYGVDIELEKRIPSGGGLGGGSSDAASVLLALNRLWGAGLSRRELMTLALSLGADVPVFVFGRNAFAEGIGEDLRALELPMRWYVLVEPAAHVPTADIFKDDGLTRNTSPVIITDFSSQEDLLSGTGSGADKAAGAFAGAQIGQLETRSKMSRADSPEHPGSSFGRNDLEPVVMRRFPAVELARQWVTQSVLHARVGPCGEVRMTGSGACLFIECVSMQQAASIKAAIAATIRYSDEAASAIRSVAVCSGLDRHPLQHWAA